MRIVTRPDFDGIVCAVLILEAENANAPVKWVSPNDMQKGAIEIFTGDIIANLPYHPNCSLWFDHHFSNRLRHKTNGLFDIVPSAAGLVYQYFQSRLEKDFTELVAQTDKIDSANLTLDEILTPERYPYILLSMTIRDHIPSDEPYWNKVLSLLRNTDITTTLSDTDVRKRCDKVIQENISYHALLKKHTQLQGHVAITDFRNFDKMPYGNRFMVYSIFPDSAVSVKIGFENSQKEKVVIKVGSSILNNTCQVNVGQMLSYFDGGGHKGAGACRFPVAKTDEYLQQIIAILSKNEPSGGIVVKIQRRDQDRRYVDDRRKTIQEAPAIEGMTERRKDDRRIHPEQRKNWKRKTVWKSIKITL